MSAPVFIITPGTAEPAGSPLAQEVRAPSSRPGSRGPLALASLDSGDEIVLTGSEARHAVSVRRLRAPERVDLVDGSGLRLLCTVTSAGGRDRLGVRVVERVEEPVPPLHLVLVQALAKGGRDEQAVETATEVGVETVLPWRARRCVSVWQEARRARGRSRWQATAREAAKQARRAVVPQVEQVRSTDGLASWVGQATQAGGVVALLHEEARTPLSVLLFALLPVLPPPASSGEVGRPAGADVLAEAPPSASSGQVARHQQVSGEGQVRIGWQRPVVAVVVGPEGGIDEGEISALEEAGAVTVRLGPHVLRTASAGPLALAVLAQGAGLWDPGD